MNIPYLQLIGDYFQVSSLELVVQRRGGYVYKGWLNKKTVYIKLSELSAPFKREVEILQALPEAAFFPQLIAHAELQGWYARVISEIPGIPLSQGLPTIANDTERIHLIQACGKLLASFHQAVTEPELTKLQFWRQDDQAQSKLPQWQGYIQRLVNKWVGRIRFTEPDKRLHLDNAVNKIVNLSAHTPEPAVQRILHCDFVGRNIIVDAHNHSVGLIDFEEVQIGDPAYDAAKFVWATLDWQSQKEVLAFYNAWSQAYGAQPDWDLFKIYVAIQSIAAIAWCDKNTLDTADNAQFRANAVRTLITVAESL
ncbi:MAG: aminoglycoside phosphotransferase family protein [Methylophilus sp.]|uniref:aminoglycoside phosphotransferase family protein n=1 Tax=Methylophilus sp. TaxID=29541 RepID=UPI003FA13044